MQLRRTNGSIAYSVMAAAVLITISSARSENADLTGNLILHVSGDTVRWAAVLRKPDPANKDPWYHIEVIEKDLRTEPWLFRRLANHMAITADALRASRVPGRAKTYTYKDVEFRYAYREWMKRSAPMRDRTICRTTVLECLQQNPEDRRDAQ